MGRLNRRGALTLCFLSCLSCGGGKGSEAGHRAVIQNKGSDTLVNVAQAWAEAYGKVNPSVVVSVAGGGSGTGISALINGTVDLANSSRPLSVSEANAVIQARGVKAEAFVVGYDALAVFVHRQNPLEALTIPQIAEIYREGGTVDRWEQLGVRVPDCPSGKIVRVSRQNNSGTYTYFAEAVLQKNDYKLGSLDLHGSKDVVDLVSKTPCAIGYSGLAYASPGVRMPCVAREEGAPCISPTMETAVDGSYPIARPLFMFTAGEPEGAVKEYLDWILSDEGQCILVGKGYAPVRANLPCLVPVTG